MLMQPAKASVAGTATLIFGCALVIAFLGKRRPWMTKLRFLIREADYAGELRKTTRSPVFSVGADQVEVGRIQGRQVAALLPRGGSVLRIQGPSVSSVSPDRHTGLQALLAPNVDVTSLRGRWTEESAHQSVCSWLRLVAAQRLRIDLIVAQNDVMGKGPRKAIEETIVDADRDHWLGIPITGVRWPAKNGPDLGPHRAIDRNRGCAAQHQESHDPNDQSPPFRDLRSRTFLHHARDIARDRKSCSMESRRINNSASERVHPQVNLGLCLSQSKSITVGGSNETMDDINNLHGSVAYDHSGGDWRNTAARFRHEEGFREYPGRTAHRSLCADQ